MVDTNKMEEFKYSPPSQKKKEEKKGKTGQKKTSAQVNTNINNSNNNNNKGQQGKQQAQQYWSNVICYNYNRKGYRRESCSSVNRGVSGTHISEAQKRNSEVVGAKENSQQT